MKLIIVGLGTQGKKRIKYIDKSAKLIGTVDPNSHYSKYKYIENVPLNLYDTVFICVQDDLKESIIDFCISNNKNIFIEKPLIIKSVKKLEKIEKIINKKKLILYTAYNHRFEPHLVSLKKILEKNLIGKIYSCRMFYGNGTAKLVKSSSWRDKKSGVFSDLAPHLIDLCYFLFGFKKVNNFKLISSFKHENKSSDHVIIKSKNKKINIELEMTLCMWKNHFTCDLIGENGSAHISSLCKWGPSKLIVRKRKLPSGVPKETIKVLIKKDPTWTREYKYFKKILKEKEIMNLKKDIKILNNIKIIEKSMGL